MDASNRMKASVRVSGEEKVDAGVEQGRAHDPMTVVIFGASGDLSKRKLIPALYQLQRRRATCRIAMRWSASRAPR